MLKRSPWLNNIYYYIIMYGPEGNSFVFSRVLMIRTRCIKCFVIYLDFLFNNHSKTNKQTTERATTAELYPGRDIFVFYQGHVTKNRPISVLVLLNESLGI